MFFICALNFVHTHAHTVTAQVLGILTSSLHFDFTFGLRGNSAQSAINKQQFWLLRAHGQRKSSRPASYLSGATRVHIVYRKCVTKGVFHKSDKSPVTINIQVASIQTLSIGSRHYAHLFRAHLYKRHKQQRQVFDSHAPRNI